MQGLLGVPHTTDWPGQLDPEGLPSSAACEDALGAYPLHDRAVNCDLRLCTVCHQEKELSKGLQGTRCRRSHSGCPLCQS